VTGEYRVIRTDERIEAVRSLEMTHKMLLEVQHDVYYWKWVVIALHSAIQNFIVSAISGSNGLGALTDKSAREWIEAYESQADAYPEEKLADFLELYKRMKKQCGFSPSPRVNKNIRQLHKHFRNNFIHFTPKGWSIIVDGFPQMMMDCLQPICFLAWESGSVLWYEENMQDTAKASYESCMKILISLYHEYTGKS